jgi:hypothetical protein
MKGMDAAGPEKIPSQATDSERTDPLKARLEQLGARTGLQCRRGWFKLPIRILNRLIVPSAMRSGR